MKILTLNLPEVTTGTDLGDDYEFNLPDNEIFNLENATCKIQFRKAPGSPLAQEFKTDNGSIIIEPPYKIRWPSQTITAKPDVYQWQLRIRYPDRDEIPWGGSITVKPAITII